MKVSEEDKNNEINILINFCNQYWEEMRHIENQRSTFANLTIVLSTMISAFIAQKAFSSSYILLAFTISVLGILGFFFTLKLYERHSFGQNRLNVWYKKIDSLAPNANFLLLLNQADSHNTSIGCVVGKLRYIQLYKIWLCFYSILTVFGFCMAVYMCFN